jgi:hypothetical protein
MEELLFLEMCLHLAEVEEELEVELTQELLVVVVVTERLMAPQCLVELEYLVKVEMVEVPFRLLQAIELELVVVVQET